VIACYDPRHPYGAHHHNPAFPHINMPESASRHEPRLCEADGGGGCSRQVFWLEPTKFILIQLDQKDVATVRKVLHALPGIGEESDIVICKHISMAPGISPTEEWDTAFKLMQKYNDAFHGMRDQIG